MSRTGAHVPSLSGQTERRLSGGDGDSPAGGADVTGGMGSDAQPLCFVGLRARYLTHDATADASAFAVAICAWSPGAEEILGFRADEVVGASCEVIVPPERIDELRDAVAALMRGQHVPPLRMLWRHADGHDIPVRVVLHAFLVGDTAPAVAAIVTDLARAESVDERLRQAQRAMLVGNITAGVAHEFNNLVAVMFGYNELVLGGLADDDPHREYLLEVRAAVDRATQLTRGLLAFGRRKSSAGVVDVNALLREMDGMIRVLAGKYVHVTFGLCPDVLAVSAPPTQIEQAIVNLCLNARDAMTAGGALAIETRRVSLDAAAAATHGATPGLYTLLVVSDTGVGMDESLLSRIWEPFFTSKDAAAGPGLGLPALLGIVRHAGGFVNVESKPGLGTTFRVYLPAAHARRETGDGTFEERVALPVHTSIRSAAAAVNNVR